MKINENAQLFISEGEELLQDNIAGYHYQKFSFS
jgi:hypothetical protein